MYKDALAEYEVAIRLSGEFHVVGGALGHTCAISGQTREAEKVLARLHQLSEKQYVPPYGVAVVYAGLGKTDEALRWLDKACDDRAPWLVWLRIDPRLDRLRSDPRFARIVKKVGI